MKLDYEESTPEDIKLISSMFQNFSRRFLESGGKADIHEVVLKPKMELFSGAKIVEVGVGEGVHLNSYAGLDYRGYDIDPKMVATAMKYARYFGIPSTTVQCISPGEIPLEDSSVDRLFSICTIHEVQDTEKIFRDLDRLIKPSGIVSIIERMCAIDETPEHVRNLKNIPGTLQSWFANNSYHVQDFWFKATYWGESLTAEPSFNFYMLLANKC